MKIDDVIETNFKSAQQKAIVNIRYTSNYLSNIQNGFMNEFDLTMAQFNILRILRGAKRAININTVKTKMVEKSPNVTRIMDKLELKKLLIRTHCTEDRRAVFVEITKDGLKLLKKIDNKISENQLFPQNLTDEEANTLSDLLDKIREEFK
jgi:MarR family 2-MHQ and catechol resistance regulon transcriptional repressor